VSELNRVGQATVLGAGELGEGTLPYAEPGPNYDYMNYIGLSQVCTRRHNAES
jgi:hypothetical protein